MSTLRYTVVAHISTLPFRGRVYAENTNSIHSYLKHSEFSRDGSAWLDLSHICS
jgi:hypothetical protein